MPMPQTMEQLVFKIHTDITRINSKYPGYAETAYQALNIVWSLDTTPLPDAMDKIEKLLDTMPQPQRRHLVHLVCDFGRAVEIGIKDGFLRPSPSEENNDDASSLLAEM